MRYFAHDGSTTHGPASVDELTAAPWFDGDMLVCPVGSDDSRDWKPALAYPDFKTALLSPRRMGVAAPPAPEPAAPAPAAAPAAAFTPCPHCGAGNPSSARFCNGCGWRMDGKPTEPPAAASPVFAPPAPVFAPPPAAFTPPTPVFTPPAPAFAPPPAFTPPAPEPYKAPEPAFGEPSGVVSDAPAVYELPDEPAAPAPASEPAFGVPAGEPEPAREPFRPVFDAPAAEPLRPMERKPERAGPMSRGLSAGPTDAGPEPEHSFESLTSQMPHPIEPSLAPDVAPSEAPAAAAPAWKKPPVIAAFIGAAALTAFAGWKMLAPAPRTAAEPSGADLNLSAPAPSEPAPTSASSTGGSPLTAMDSPPPMPAKPAPKPGAMKSRHGDSPAPPAKKRLSTAASAPTASAAPSFVKKRLGPARPIGATLIDTPDRPEPAARKPRKVRAQRAAPVPPPDSPDAADAILIESRAGGEEPAVPGGAPDGGLSEPAGQAPASNDMLPGIPRRPGMKSAKPKAAAKAPAPVSDNPLEELADPGSAASVGGSAPSSSSAEAAAPKASAPVSEADKLALQQAVEEFEFCAQLLAQGAYADHFDTCLCKETRQKAPYRDRRGFYADSLTKEAKAGRLEVKADIVSTRMENGQAHIVAKWKSKAADPGREVDEVWIMDDGLWCKAP